MAKPDPNKKDNKSDNDQLIISPAGAVPDPNNAPAQTSKKSNPAKDVVEVEPDPTPDNKSKDVPWLKFPKDNDVYTKMTDAYEKLQHGNKNNSKDYTVKYKDGKPIYTFPDKASAKRFIESQAKNGECNFSIKNKRLGITIPGSTEYAYSDGKNVTYGSTKAEVDQKMCEQQASKNQVFKYVSLDGDNTKLYYNLNQGKGLQTLPYGTDEQIKGAQKIFDNDLKKYSDQFKKDHSPDDSNNHSAQDQDADRNRFSVFSTNPPLPTSNLEQQDDAKEEKDDSHRFRSMTI